MNSMTGFGSAAQRDRRLDLEVEVRSVNHRFFTLKKSLPEGMARHEADVERMVRGKIARGSLSLTVSARTARSAAPALPDMPALRKTCRDLRRIRKELGLAGDVRLEDLLSVPGLWSDGEAREPADLWPKTRRLVAKALDALVATRAREGRTIERDLRARLGTIERHLEVIGGRAPRVSDVYEKRLEERIDKILSQKGWEVARPDVAKEIAVHADRCDISEELQRLAAHTEEFRNILRSKGQVGRRLDFLTQEMLRETNTIASKGNDAGISAAAVAIKAEIEKIKEQVENVE